MHPLVSVIIPAYNAEKYVHSSLASVLKQTYQNLEIIVVNDGSTDRTEEIVNTFEDKRIKIISIPNSGQCAAANIGFSLSKGEYIKYFDADDLMNVDHITSMVATANNDKVSLVLCKWARFYDSIEDAKFKVRPEWDNFSSSIDFFKAALSNGPDMLPIWQWLIPRNVIELCGGWDENLGLGNDFEYSSRLLMTAEGVKFCDKAWVYYRSGLSTNMSTDISHKTFMSVLNAIHKSKEHILSKVGDADINQAFANKYYSWLITYYPYLDDDTVEDVEATINNLGKVNYSYNWGWKFNLISKLLGWKRTRRLQLYYYTKRY